MKRTLSTLLILGVIAGVTACKNGEANTAGDNETGEVSIETTATTEARSETVAEITIAVTEVTTKVDVTETETMTTREPETKASEKVVTAVTTSTTVKQWGWDEESVFISGYLDLFRQAETVEELILNTLNLCESFDLSLDEFRFYELESYSDYDEENPTFLISSFDKIKLQTENKTMLQDGTFVTMYYGGGSFIQSKFERKTTQ